MPWNLSRLLAPFCKSFGQTCYMVKISDKWRHIWLLDSVEKGFKSRQTFCTESVSTRLLPNKPDHRHPWLIHGFLELFLPNPCFATFYRPLSDSEELCEEKVGVTMWRKRDSHGHTSTTRQFTGMDNSKSHNKPGKQLTSAPGLPPDAEARVILVRFTCWTEYLDHDWLLLLQEARKEGFFAALTSGLASGEHLSRHKASRVMM